MTLEEVNIHNIDIAIDIQHSIFPLENGSQDLIDSINNNIPKHQFLSKYYLAKYNNEYIGICGLYAYNDYPTDAWLGWFGVIEKERNKGYGTNILKKCFLKAKKQGFENIRLYTDEIDNANAIKLYKKFGMIHEIYNNPKDIHFEIGNTLIFSKNLYNKPVDLWNNKYLYLDIHDENNNQIK